MGVAQRSPSVKTLKVLSFVSVKEDIMRTERLVKVYVTVRVSGILFRCISFGDYLF